MTKKHSLILLLVMLLVMACTPQVPSEYIQPGDMEDILYDYHVGQAVVKTEHRGSDMDVERTRIFRAVLHKHGVTEADFDSSMVYYYSHLVRLKKIYVEVNERLADDAKELGATVSAIGRYSKYSATGDTANIWKGASDVMLLPCPTMNRYDFTIKADTSFYKGDSFMFQFMSEYIWQTGMKEALVCIVSKYEGDSIIQTVNHISISGLSQIRIPANRENRLKEMRGFIYLGTGKEENDRTRKQMFISQMQFIRFHNKEMKDEGKDEKKDSVNHVNKDAKKDSLQRVVDPRRPKADTAGRRNLQRPSTKVLPLNRGNSKR